MSESLAPTVPRYASVPMQPQPEVELMEYEARMKALVFSGASSSENIGKLPELCMTPQGMERWVYNARHYEAMAHAGGAP
jgi:hypothetical protein